MAAIAIPRADDGADDDAALDGAPATRVRGYWRSVLYRLRHDWVTLGFGAAVLAILLLAVFAPLIAPFDPYQQSIIGRLKPFGWRGHPWGTDELGRDMMSRLFYGGRISLLMGLAPVVVATVVGGTLEQHPIS
jgi:peptide/nickel transport system permease protein